MIQQLRRTHDTRPAAKAITTVSSRLTVGMERAGQAIFSTPPTCAAALAALRTRRLLVRPDRDQGSRIVAVPEPLLFERPNALGDPSLAGYAGLGPIVTHVLERAGYSVARTGGRRPPLGAPNIAAVAAHGPVDRALLDLVRDHDRGLVRFDSPGVDIAWLVTQIALAFPADKIAVLAARYEDVRRVARDLLAWSPDVGWATGRSRPDHPTRLVVSTFWAAGNPIVRLWERDIVVVVDAVAALGKRARYVIQHAPRARVYGLMDRAHDPAPRDADWLVALFGLEEAVIPRHGHAERAVDVVFEPIRGGPTLDAARDIVTLKRRGIWRHPVRNRRVARLADALVRGEIGPLMSFPAIVALLRAVTAPRVAILVEGVEHALALAHRLPDWPVLVAPDISHAGLPAEACRTLARRRVPSAVGRHRVIVTLAALDRFPIGEFDVIVRADGSPYLLDALATRLITARRDRRPLVLVDFDDRRHPLLRRWSRARRAAYYYSCN